MQWIFGYMEWDRNLVRQSFAQSMQLCTTTSQVDSTFHNAGRIRAYNVFITSNNKLTNVVGGARKRAAYTIINSKVKKIVGVYFQSQDGETFYEEVRK